MGVGGRVRGRTCRWLGNYDARLGYKDNFGEVSGNR